MYLLITLCLHLTFGVWAEEDAYIIGGQDAQLGQFPHQISLQLHGSHSCGGSIIQFDTILTAAHCVYGEVKESLTVVAGIIHLDQGTDCQTVGVRSIIMHPEYNRNTLQNDIAIIKLSTNLIETRFVSRVPLRQSLVLPDIERLFVSGWGVTSNPGGTVPNELKTLELRSTDIVTCGLNLQFMGIPVTLRNLCTTTPEGQGTCFGDSGGPLVDLQGRQVGVVSWGYPCAHGFPDVFTSVNFFYNWILSQ